MILTVPVRDVFETNCYFYADNTTEHAFLIDPGAEGERLVKIADSSGWNIDAVLLTHGHFDHTGGIKAILKHISPPVFAHKMGRFYLTDTTKNLSKFCSRHVIIDNAQYFNDGDELKLSDEHTLKVIYTPGHTEDSVIFYDSYAGIAFVGDTIFKGSIGESRYPGGNANVLISSIMDKIFALPDDTVLYSGHSEPTTVGEEKERYFFEKRTSGIPR